MFFLDPTRHPFPAQTCRVGSLLGGRIHLESHFHLASAAAATEVYNYYIPIIIYMKYSTSFLAPLIVMAISLLFKALFF